MIQLHEVLSSNTCGAVPHWPSFTLKISGPNDPPSTWTGTYDAWQKLTKAQQAEFKSLVSAKRASFPSDDQDDWNNYLSYMYSTDANTAADTVAAFSGDWVVNSADTTDTTKRKSAVTSYNNYYTASTGTSSPVSKKASYIKVDSDDNYVTTMPTSIQTAYTKFSAGKSAGSLTRLWANLSSDNDLKTTATKVDGEMTKLDKSVEKFKGWTEQFTNYFRDKYLNDAGQPATQADRGKVIPLNYAYVDDDNKLIVPNWTW